MRNILIIEIWRHAYSAVAAVLTMVVVFLWPSIPLFGVSNWLQFIYYYFPQNILYVLLTILSGLYIGIYVYYKKVCTTCPTKNAKSGGVGIIGGVLLGACPACIPVIAFFLPLGVSIYLSRISWVFLVLGVILVAYLVYKMGGLSKVVT